jgi:hypothetical protein
MGPELDGAARLDGAAGDALAREADLVRTRLARALGALNGKRREVLDAGGRLKHAVELTAVAGLALLVVGGGALLIHRAKVARQRRWSQRWGLVQRAWYRPESLREREGTLGKVMKSVAAGLATMVARRLTAQVFEAMQRRDYLALSTRATT